MGTSVAREELMREADLTLAEAVGRSVAGSAQVWEARSLECLYQALRANHRQLGVEPLDALVHDDLCLVAGTPWAAAHLSGYADDHMAWEVHKRLGDGSWGPAFASLVGLATDWMDLVSMQMASVGQCWPGTSADWSSAGCLELSEASYVWRAGEGFVGRAWVGHDEGGTLRVRIDEHRGGGATWQAMPCSHMRSGYDPADIASALRAAAYGAWDEGRHTARGMAGGALDAAAIASRVAHDVHGLLEAPELGMGTRKAPSGKRRR